MMYRKAGAGFTLIELVIVISIVAVLASMLFKRVIFYQEMAEKAAMEQVVGAVQSALVLQYGHRMARGMGPEIKNLVTDNPLEWLTQKPASYAGDKADISSPQSLPPGSWAFDQRAHELVYVPDHAEHFEAGRDGNKWVRFRVKFVYEQTGRGRAANMSGVVFSPVEPYKWLIKDAT